MCPTATVTCISRIPLLRTVVTISFSKPTLGCAKTRKTGQESFSSISWSHLFFCFNANSTLFRYSQHTLKCTNKCIQLNAPVTFTQAKIKNISITPQSSPFLPSEPSLLPQKQPEFWFLSQWIRFVCSWTLYKRNHLNFLSGSFLSVWCFSG